MTTVQESWDALEEPWRLCLSLAWEAYGAGTIPVGAVLADHRGAVVSTGRNRVYDETGPSGQLAHSLLAHAEVNALVGLDPHRRYRDHTLYSSLEPCLLCVGAAYRATVGAVRYAGAEPYRGAAPHRGGLTPAEAGRVSFDGPRSDEFGVLASALPVAFYLEHPDGAGDLIELSDREIPSATATARHLVALAARDLAAQRIPLPEALPTLWPPQR